MERDEEEEIFSRYYITKQPRSGLAKATGKESNLLTIRQNRKGKRVNYHITLHTQTYLSHLNHYYRLLL